MADGERPNSSGDASALLRRGPSGCGLTAPVAVAPVELRRGGNCKVSGGVLGAKDFFSDGCVWVGAPRSRCHIQCDDLRPPAQRKPGANSTEGGSGLRGARYQGLPQHPPSLLLVAPPPSRACVRSTRTRYAPPPSRNYAPPPSRRVSINTPPDPSVPGVHAYVIDDHPIPHLLSSASSGA